MGEFKVLVRYVDDIQKGLAPRFYWLVLCRQDSGCELKIMGSSPFSVGYDIERLRNVLY
jgi:hypothetical protein